MTEFLLIMWPVVIYIAYKFVWLNISHIEKSEESSENTK